VEIETMPKRVTVIKTVTYDVEQIIADLKEQGMEEPGFSDAMEMIEEFVKDDFSCGWGHEANPGDMIYLNADTEEEI